MANVNMNERDIVEALNKMSQEDFKRLMNTHASQIKAESNQELIEKAVIVSTALSSTGKLNPRQAAKFAQYVFDLTELTGKARTFTFRNEQMDIDKIGVHKRVAEKFTEKTDPGIRRGVTHSKVSLNPKKIMVPFEISDDYLLTNIEGLTVEELIVKMMATQFANDLEDLYINGDIKRTPQIQGDIEEGGSTTNYVRDEFLGLTDGWLRRADAGNLYNALNSADVRKVMAGALKTLPKKYKKRRNGLEWVAAPDLVVNLIQNLTTAGTPLSDAAFLGQIAALTPYGIPILDPPMMDMRPLIVEEKTFTGANSTVNLRYQNVTDVVVIVNTLGNTPTAAYALTTDYTQSLANGTVTQTGGGGIGANETVLIRYRANPQLLLTYPSNLMLGIGLDVTVETDRNIFTQCNQWAITAKVDANIEEVDAVVKVHNIQDAFI